MAADARGPGLRPDVELRFAGVVRRYPVPAALTAVAFAIVAGLGVSWWLHLRPAIVDCPVEAGAAERQDCEGANRARSDRWTANADIATKAATGALALAAGLVALHAHDLNRRHHDLDREGQITTRYTAAIAQLGEADRPEVVLGGIHALERIGRDSPDTDLRTIVQVLSAYVRRLHPRLPAAAPGDADEAGATGPRWLPIEQQAALEVAVGLVHAATARRPPLDPDPRVDLRRVRLAGVDLATFDLTRVDLTGSDLTAADLTGAVLAGACLHATTLRRAVLADADLTGVRASVSLLPGYGGETVYLTGLALAGADVPGLAPGSAAAGAGAYFSAVDLSGARLENADARGAQLTGAVLTGAWILGADLTGAHLGGAFLDGAHLVEVDLTGATLRGASLVGAELRGSTLTGADLTGAHLHGADLTGTDLTAEQRAAARWDPPPA